MFSFICHVNSASKNKQVVVVVVVVVVFVVLVVVVVVGGGGCSRGTVKSVFTFLFDDDSMCTIGAWHVELHVATERSKLLLANFFFRGLYKTLRPSVCLPAVST